MLFLLSSPDVTQFKTVARLAEEDERDLLLINDAVYLASGAGAELLEDQGIDRVYAEKTSVDRRGVSVSDDCQVLDMDAVVDLVVDNKKLINL